MNYLPQFDRNRVQQIEEEIKGKLFKVPNEEEIEKELKEVEDLKKLNDNLAFLQKEYQTKKGAIDARRLQKFDEEQKRLVQRYEQLVNTPKLDEQEEKLKIIAMKKRVEQDLIEEREKTEELYQLRREQELEKIVKKKLEVERIIKQKQEWNEAFRKAKLEYDIINEEEQARNTENKELLDKALKRHGDIDGLNKDYLTEKDKELLSDAIVQNKVDAENEKNMILATVQQKQSQDKRKKELETKEKLRLLNEERYSVMKEQEKLLKKKAQHFELQKKGIDFLTEMNLGNGPPLELVVKNMQYDEDDYRQEITTEEIVEKSKKNLKNVPTKLDQLKQDRNQLLTAEQLEEQKFSYKGELKPILERLDPNSKQIARSIIEFLIENTIRVYLEQLNDVEAIRSKEKYLKDKEEKLQKKIDSMVDNQVYQMIQFDIIEKIKDKIVREASTEIATVNLLAKTIAIDILIKSLHLERNTGNKEDKLNQVFYSLRNEDYSKKTDVDIEFNFMDLEEVNPKKIVKKKKKKQQDEEDLKEDKKKEDEEEDDDRTISYLYPEKETVEQQGSQAMRDQELEFWEQVNLENILFLPHNAKQKNYVNAMALSSNKQYLGIGMSSGEVYVLDSGASPSNIVAQYIPTQKRPITHIEFSQDNLGQVLTVNEDGVLNVLFNATNLLAFKNKNKQATIEPMNLMDYYSLNWEWMTRARRRYNQEEINLQISYSIFHLGITFTGIQPILLIGTNNGTVVKFNQNKDFYAEKIYKYPIHKVVNSKIITSSDTEFPKEQSNLIKPEDNVSDQEIKHPNIFREFFIEHKSKIVYLTFIQTIDRFVTVDEDGYVFQWIYDAELFSFNSGAYKPKDKNRISCDIYHFTLTQKGLKIFPKESETEQKEEEGKELYKKYIMDKDFKIKKIADNFYEKNKTNEYVLLQQKPLNIDELDLEQKCYKIQAEVENERVIEINEEIYKAEKVKGKIACCKMCRDNQIMFVEQILPHKINKDNCCIQFVRLDMNTFRLKKVRTTLESPEVDFIDFTVLENYPPFNIPYLLVLMYQGLVVISPSTGCIVAKYETPQIDIAKELKQQQIICNCIQSLGTNYLYITSNISNGVWKYQIKNNNTQDDYDAISNQSEEFNKLFNL